MDVMEALGGRKFVLTLICVGVGTVIELKTANGMSATFAGLLAALVTAFGAANAFLSAKYADGENLTDALSASLAPSLPDSRLDHLTTTVMAVTEGMTGLQEQITQANETALKAGQAVVNIGQQMESVRKLASVAIKVNGG